MTGMIVRNLGELLFTSTMGTGSPNGGRVRLWSGVGEEELWAWVG